MRRVIGAIQYSGPLDSDSLDSATKAVRFLVLEKPGLKKSDLFFTWGILPHLRIVSSKDDGTIEILQIPEIGGRFSEHDFESNETQGCGTWLVRASA